MIKSGVTEKVMPVLILGIMFLAGCASVHVLPEYDLKPEIREEISRIKKEKQPGLILQYTEVQTTEGQEGMEAGNELVD